MASCLSLGMVQTFSHGWKSPPSNACGPHPGLCWPFQIHLTPVAPSIPCSSSSTAFSFSNLQCCWPRCLYFCHFAGKMSATLQISAQMSQGRHFWPPRPGYMYLVTASTSNLKRYYCFWSVFELDYRFSEGKNHVYFGHWIYIFFPLNILRGKIILLCFNLF